MHRLIPILVFIGFFCTHLSHADEIPAIDQVPEPGMVVVEPTNIAPTTTEGDYRLIPYAERRSKWGIKVGLEYIAYEPTDYRPAFLELDYKDIYKSPSVPLIELQLEVKRNFVLGSLGLEAGVSVFKAESSEEVDDLSVSTLTLYPLRLGFTYNMDNLFSDNPWVVPYVGGGAYTIYYRETQPGVSFNGNTQVAPYAIAGLGINLDWFDRDNARIAYESSGIEATHLFVEMRKYFATAVDSDPDFETDPTWGAGIHVEF
jgi:hypothetical protein